MKAAEARAERRDRVRAERAEVVFSDPISGIADHLAAGDFVDRMGDGVKFKRYRVEDSVTAVVELGPKRLHIRFARAGGFTVDREFRMRVGHP